MKNCLVYKHTSPSGKYYIGVTNDYSRRCYEHQYAAKTGSELTFHCAIRKYGWSNFTHEILAIDLTQQQAFDMEVALINIAEKGNLYNMTLGGDGCDSKSTRNNNISKRKDTFKGYYFLTKSKKYKISLSFYSGTLNFNTVDTEDEAKGIVKYLTSLSDEDLVLAHKKFINTKHERYRGYSLCGITKRWKIYFSIYKKRVYYDSYKTEQEAKEVFDSLIILSEDDLFLEYTKHLEFKKKKVKGYSFNKHSNKYQVNLSINGKLKNYGSYLTEDEAINRVIEVKNLYTTKEE